jgi:putative tryptophan/tyrosine transport system substrate-binding protein
MRRREFITVLAGSATWPLAARAQPAGKVWRIGLLTNSREDSSANYAGFLQGMRDLGYVEGKEFVTEFRFMEGRYARLPDLAAELVRLKVDVLITGPTPAILALQQATRTIPIVGVAMTDPVGNGLVASLARPGGNTTGTAGSYEASPKQLELLAAMVPNPSRIGLLWNPDNPSNATVLKIVQDAAQKAGLVLVSIEARNPQDIENAFAAFGKERVQAVMVPADGIFSGQLEPIVKLAFSHRLPTMSVWREFAKAGGLMSYGDDRAEFYRRTAAFVDKIFKGAKPADLPVEQPTRYHLVINRRTADAFGLTIPALLYIFADEVIE